MVIKLCCFFFKESSADCGISSSLLSTVSRIVSSGSSSSTSTNPLISRNTSVNAVQTHKPPVAMHLVVWLHLASLLVTFALFWTDFIPAIGKVTLNKYLNDYALS